MGHPSLTPVSPVCARSPSPCHIPEELPHAWLWSNKTFTGWQAAWVFFYCIVKTENKTINSPYWHHSAGEQHCMCLGCGFNHQKHPQAWNLGLSQAAPWRMMTLRIHLDSPLTHPPHSIVSPCHLCTWMYTLRCREHLLLNQIWHRSIICLPLWTLPLYESNSHTPLHPEADDIF